MLGVSAITGPCGNVDPALLKLHHIPFETISPNNLFYVETLPICHATNLRPISLISTQAG